MNSFRTMLWLFASVLLAACTSQGAGPAPLNRADAIPAGANATPIRDRAVEYRIIHNFGKVADDGRKLDGAYPEGAVLFVNGALYGTTGGPSGVYNGTIFTMMPDGSYSSRDFPERLRVPHAMISFNGTFYGATQGSSKYSNGTIFSFKTGGTPTVLHAFGNAGDGYLVDGMIAANGKLYGTTYKGGAYGTGEAGGTIFTLSVTGTNYKVLHSFGKAKDGNLPAAAPIFVSNNFYGTTNAGGTYGKGTVYRIGASGSGERVLHSFGNGSDGAAPEGGLIVVNGTLYGTTSKGGTHNKGTVFAMNLDGTNERVLHSFGSAKDGQTPWFRLTESNGVLYGVTTAGGSFNRGVIYSIGKDGSNEQILHDFGDTKDDGFEASSPLTYESGTLYGLTFEGGLYLRTGNPPYPDYGGGTAYALTP